MTNRMAFELGQFAYRLKDRGADSLYDDFMKIVEELIRDEPADTIKVPVIDQPSPYVTKPWTNNPLDPPWKVTCDSIKAEKNDADLTPHADTVTRCDSAV